MPGCWVSLRLTIVRRIICNRVESCHLILDHDLAITGGVGGIYGCIQGCYLGLLNRVNWALVLPGQIPELNGVIGAAAGQGLTFSIKRLHARPAHCGPPGFAELCPSGPIA